MKFLLKKRIQAQRLKQHYISTNFNANDVVISIRISI